MYMEIEFVWVQDPSGHSVGHFNLINGWLQFFGVPGASPSCHITPLGMGSPEAAAVEFELPEPPEAPKPLGTPDRSTTETLDYSDLEFEQKRSAVLAAEAERSAGRFQGKFRLRGKQTVAIYKNGNVMASDGDKSQSATLLCIESNQVHAILDGRATQLVRTYRFRIDSPLLHLVAKGDPTNILCVF